MAETMFEDWAEMSALSRVEIRAFMDANSDAFAGAQVLDYGCGEQPYRDIIVGSGGQYHGYDRPTFPDAQVEELVGDDDLLKRCWDVVVVNEVIQLAEKPQRFVRMLREMMPEGGVLIMTYAMSWKQTRPQDLWRFTKSGVERLLVQTHFAIESHESLWQIILAPDYVLPTHYGVRAVAI